MSFECNQIDELMMDFLYRELDDARMKAYQGHLDGCPACAAQLAGFARTRALARSLAMPAEDPPVAVSAKLLRAAAEQRPQQGLWARFSAWLAPLTSHPGVAAVATFILVAGVAGFLVARHGIPDRVTSSDVGSPTEMAFANQPTATNGPPPASTVTAPPAVAPAPADPSAGAALKQDNDQADRQGAGEGGEAAPVARAPVAQQRQHELEKLADGVDSANGAGRASNDNLAQDQTGAGQFKGEIARDMGVVHTVTPSVTNGDDAKKKAIPAGGDDRGGTLGGASGATREQGDDFDALRNRRVDVNKDRNEESPAKPKPMPAPAAAVPAPALGTKGGAPAPKPPSPTTSRPAKNTFEAPLSEATAPAGPTPAAAAPAPPPADKAPAGKADPAAKPEDPAAVHGQARAKAAGGDCDAALRLRDRVYRIDPKYFDRNVKNDPALSSCIAKRDKAKAAASPARVDDGKRTAPAAPPPNTTK